MSKGQFSQVDQDAALGHALLERDFYTKLRVLGVDKSWFSSQVTGELFEYVVKFVARAKRSPNADELRNEINRTRPLDGAGDIRALDICLRAAATHLIDDLSGRLVDWAKGQRLAAGALEIQQAYNSGNHKKAFELITDIDTTLRLLDIGMTGGGDALIESNTRLDGEEEARYAESEGALSYGITLLDDLLLGIPRKEMIIVGARTGVGKTEFAKIVGRHNVKNGKIVSAFFLEAEDKEIERRIKYGMLVERWREKYEGAGRIEQTKIGYAEWHQGRCREELDLPFGKTVDEQFREEYKGLRTYYRTGGDFTVDDLERQILLAEDSDLTIVDHLQYVDLDPKNNEITETTNLVKRLRDLSIAKGRPVIAIAHLRKGAGATLVPDVDDFYGSGNITKIATTCLTLAGCTDESLAGQGLGSPTFIRAVKFRLDGSRTKYVGIGLFDRYSGKYNDNYYLGKLNFAGTKWSPISETTVPTWAKDRMIQPPPPAEGDGARD